jgi:hypothetical protein
MHARFINMSGLARKLANLKCTLNIFIMSMCRIKLSKEILAKIRQESEIENNFYKNFEADALGKNICDGFK